VVLEQAAALGSDGQYRQGKRPITTANNNGESIVIHAFAERDLAHIRNALGYLERCADYVRQTEPGAVVSVSYWHARVSAIVALPSLPLQIEMQAKELLGRIDRLEAARQSAEDRKDVRPLSSAL
jgi:hypothetical protein